MDGWPYKINTRVKALREIKEEYGLHYLPRGHIHAMPGDLGTVAYVSSDGRGYDTVYVCFDNTHTVTEVEYIDVTDKLEQVP